MTDRELLQQALDMLDDINQCSLPPTGIPLPAEIDHVMEALRARLAQREPEPVAWGVDEGEGRCISLHDLYFVKKDADHMAELKGTHAKVVALYTAPPKKDEPVIDKSMAKRIATQLGWEPKREWVGLTDEEARELCVANVPYVIDMVRALEAKLKEKNSG